MDVLKDPITELIRSYHELNSQTVDELTEEPSPLEFVRYVATNRPFVVRKAAKDWKACARWSVPYIDQVMCGRLGSVAITPHGNADSVIEDPSTGELIFIKPFERDEPMDSTLRRIQEQELNDAYSGPTHYLQTQNDNLRQLHFSPLLRDVPLSIPFARIALRKAPDAVNFWLGNSHSTTALHKDNYENIYVQVLGRKHFVLLPPVEAPVVNERWLPGASYDESMNVVRDADAEGKIATVPIAVWDPDHADVRATPWAGESRAMRVTLDEGDMLYLPALWYHKVSQSCNAEGICCAVNYWYDMEFSGSFYPMCNFVRKAGMLAAGEHEKQDRDDVNVDEIDMVLQTMAD